MMFQSQSFFQWGVMASRLSMHSLRSPSVIMWKYLYIYIHTWLYSAYVYHWSKGHMWITQRALCFVSESVVIYKLCMLYYTYTYGCFLKWWYRQNTRKWSFSVRKPMVVGHHHFRNPPIWKTHKNACTMQLDFLHSSWWFFITNRSNSSVTGLVVCIVDLQFRTWKNIRINYPAKSNYSWHLKKTLANIL